MLMGLPRLGKLRKLKSHKAPSQGFKSSNNCWERGLSSQPSKQQVMQQAAGVRVGGGWGGWIVFILGGAFMMPLPVSQPRSHEVKPRLCYRNFNKVH